MEHERASFLFGHGYPVLPCCDAESPSQHTDVAAAGCRLQPVPKRAIISLAKHHTAPGPKLKHVHAVVSPRHDNATLCSAQ